MCQSWDHAPRVMKYGMNWDSVSVQLVFPLLKQTHFDNIKQMKRCVRTPGQQANHCEITTPSYIVSAYTLCLVISIQHKHITADGFLKVPDGIMFKNVLFAWSLKSHSRVASHVIEHF